ncbi:hypothetical protein P8452_51618 [Trifolium repens]|nr:hypothetical protein P8452_51618 [Trifolium repens]
MVVTASNQTYMCFVYRFCKYHASKQEWNISFYPDDDVFKCSCKKMESFGLPCEHIIALLVFLDIAELPNTLVVARWTKNAKEAICSTISESGDDFNSHMDQAAADIHKMETKRGLNDGGGATNSGQTDHEILRDPAPIRSKGCAGVSFSSTKKKKKQKQCTTCKTIGHNKQTCERRRHRANTTHLPNVDSHNNEFSDDSVGGMSSCSIDSKMKNMLSPRRNQTTMPKMLSFSTSPIGRHLKVPKLEIKENKIMSKLVETNFVTTEEMKLQPVEEHVACYVFHVKNDLSEELFKAETLKGSRKEFQTLCPGRIIDTKIIHMMSSKINWIERNAASQTTWSLPPSFVGDVNCGLTIEELVKKYGKNWMPHFENLKYVYLPIEDCVGNWFLMIGAIDDQVLYHFDPGYERRNIIPRQLVIRKMWQAITKMVQTMVHTHYFPPEFLCEVHQHIDN